MSFVMLSCPHTEGFCALGNVVRWRQMNTPGRQLSIVGNAAPLVRRSTAPAPPRALLSAQGPSRGAALLKVGFSGDQSSGCL